MTMKMSTAEAAKKSPTTHQFLPGVGHIEHPALPLDLPKGRTECNPPAGTPDGSLHFLRAQPHVKPVEFVWHATHRAWARANGNRQAWPADYLAAAGWTYVGRA